MARLEGNFEESKGLAEMCDPSESKNSGGEEDGKEMAVQVRVVRTGGLPIDQTANSGN